MVVSDRLKNAKLKPEQVKDFDITGAVRQCLDVLITQEQLAKGSLNGIPIRTQTIFCLEATHGSWEMFAYVKVVE